ncbi:MAG: beta-lactamase family protein [Deltaproteobacteria bacterium]|nr:beta-lactamase family protein [Deltaproteobacteria bacterium]
MQECGRAVFQDESESILPGEEFRYSGDAWQLAGAVAEVVSGSSWAQLVEERLVAPCGLPNTGYLNGGAVSGYPHEFDGDPANIPPSENPPIDRSAYSTVNDYSKVLLMHLNGGLCGQARPERVLSSEMVQLMQEDLVPAGVALPSFRPEAVNYGMGWWRFEEDSRLLVDSGAWGARAVLHPDEGSGAILIIELNTVATPPPCSPTSQRLIGGSCISSMRVPRCLLSARSAFTGPRRLRRGASEQVARPVVFPAFWAWSRAGSSTSVGFISWRGTSPMRITRRFFGGRSTGV